MGASSSTGDAPGGVRLVLETDAGVVELPADCFVVFVDETGHELLSDPRYPVFGFGGCGVLVSDYVRLLELPWQQMKAAYFGGAHKPLHAADLRSPTPDQRGVLAAYFSRFHFCRFAAVVSEAAVLEVENPWAQIVAHGFVKRIVEVARHQRFGNVAIIFEGSARGDALVKRYFSGFEAFRWEVDDVEYTAPITKYIAPKGLTAGLEVADFVAHTAGTAVRTWRQKGVRKDRKDFAAVFKEVDERVVSFMEITKATPTVL